MVRSFGLPISATHSLHAPSASLTCKHTCNAFTLTQSQYEIIALIEIIVTYGGIRMSCKSLYNNATLKSQKIRNRMKQTESNLATIGHRQIKAKQIKPFREEDTSPPSVPTSASELTNEEPAVSLRETGMPMNWMYPSPYQTSSSVPRAMSLHAS